MYYSRRKFVLRNLIAQTVFRIVSAVTIMKTIRGIEWDIYNVILNFKRLKGIPNVAVLVRPIVHKNLGKYIFLLYPTKTCC